MGEYMENQKEKSESKVKQTSNFKEVYKEIRYGRRPKPIYKIIYDDNERDR
jgi:hypothetical protein